MNSDTSLASPRWSRPRRHGASEGGQSAAQAPTLAVVIDLVRRGIATTRPQIAERSGWGRAVVAQRVDELFEHGLLADDGRGPSTGGRAPRRLRFRAEAGYLLTAEFGATSVAVALADIAGRILASHEEDADIAVGPERALRHLEELFDGLLRQTPAAQPAIWGIGIGLPGPVEFSTSQPIAPPIMPGWDHYPIRDRLAARYGAPVWVDNEVNLMALGELRDGLARNLRDVLHVKIGTGIGAGIISNGQLHRGMQGCAGDLGHVAVTDDPTIVCRCGNIGCLEAVAGGAAIARAAQAAAAEGDSRHLAQRLSERHPITARDVAEGAQHGDRYCVDLLQRSGRTLGATLATLVNVLNPGLIVIGGGVAQAGDLLLAAIRETLYRRSLPLATRELQIARSELSDQAGITGAAHMVIDELFSPAGLSHWLKLGSPCGHPEIAGDSRRFNESQVEYTNLLRR